MAHLTLPFLRRVLGGELPPRVLLRFLVEHLGDRCPECGENLAVLRDREPAAGGTDGLPAAGEVAVPGAAPVPDARYCPAFDEVERTAVAWAERARREAVQARRDLAALLRLPAEARRDRIVRARTRFRSRGLAEALLAEARRRSAQEPEEAEGLASLVPVALRRVADPAGREWAAILTFRAQALGANALRLAGRLRESEQAFGELRGALASGGIEDPSLLAEVCSLEASLQIARGRLPAARELIRDAARLYRRVGEREGLVKVLVQRGMLERQDDHPAAAVASHAKALAMAQEDDLPNLAATAAGNLALALCDLERFGEAEDVLERHGTLLRCHSDPRSRPLVRNIRGRVAWGLGRRREAEELLLGARDELVAQRRPLHAGVAALDLAVLYLEEGRTAEVQETARLLAGLFAAEDVDPMVVASLMVLQAAAAAERITLESIRTLQRRLEESEGRHRPAALPS